MTLPSDVANALIVAQNALSGYVALANGYDAQTDLQLAQHAFNEVREVIRAHGVIEQQGSRVALGDVVRLTDAYRRAIETGSAFRNGQVVDIHDDVAEVDWLDPVLPREVELAALEKVERVKRPEAWVDCGYAVGDRVRYSGQFLRSTGQVDRQTANMRGEIVEIKPVGGSARATVKWEDGRQHGVMVRHLEKIRERERA